MYKIETNLTETPYVNQICVRLNALKGIYGLCQLESCLAVILAGQSSKQVILARHIHNLVLSYDKTDINDALYIMCLLQNTQEVA
jgi:hypothetical protein